MGTIWIRELTGGLDTRRLPEVTPGGSLILARDGHINRGGEFEKRAAFVKVYSLPPGTRGLAAGADKLYVFGDGADPGVPPEIGFQQLAYEGKTLARIASCDLYANKIYAVAVYDDGTRMHFYDGVVVEDWKPGNGAGRTPGDFVMTYETKVYALYDTVVAFSGVGNPTDFDPFVAGSGGAPDTGAAGAGAIDMASQVSGLEKLRAIAEYQNYLAIFGDRVIMTWVMDVNPENNKKAQTLKNTGTIAPLSVTQFGDADLFYLDESGVRSLRARDSSNAAATTDVGVAVDNLVTAKVRTLTDNERARVIGLIEPLDGRFWLIVKDEIFVFSYFPGSKVSAWTTYSPGFNIEDAVVFRRKVYLRSGDDIYVYGGLGDTLVYDATEPEVWFPYLDADQPTRLKTLTGIDVVCSGTWEVRIGMQPTDLDATDKVAVVTETTLNRERIPATGQSTHFSLRFRGVGPGPKKLSSAVIHYDGGDGEGT